jgi:hypothetical protein
VLILSGISFDPKDLKLIYVCTYKECHYFKIPLTDNYFIPVELGAGAINHLKQIYLDDFYKVCKAAGVEEE